MGNSVSEMVKKIDQGDEKEKVKKEQLELMMKLADARLDTFQEKLNRMFLDNECKSFCFWFEDDTLIFISISLSYCENECAREACAAL